MIKVSSTPHFQADAHLLSFLNVRQRLGLGPCLYQGVFLFVLWSGQLRSLIIHCEPNSIFSYLVRFGPGR